MQLALSRCHVVALGAGLLLAGCQGTASTDLGSSQQGIFSTNTTRAVQVADIDPGLRDSDPHSFVNVNGTVFFAASDRGGTEVHKSDGKDATLLLDVTPGPGGDSNADLLTDVSGTLFFTARTGGFGFNQRTLWKSDGTTTGTVLVKTFSAFSIATVRGLRNVDGTLFFAASDMTGGADINGVELWKSDGTTAGTVMVKDINPGPDSSTIGEGVNFNGTLFFVAQEPISGGELWKSDGTAAGTVMVRDINPGPDSGGEGFLTLAGGTLFFTAIDHAGGTSELWKSDGTTDGTVKVKSIKAEELIDLSGTLFFRGFDSINGPELWKSDGTTDGTVLVKDINPGPGGGFPFFLTSAGGTLFFVADDGSSGSELWKSDGTSAGTVMVKDINPNGDSSPIGLTDVNGTLFFEALDGAGGLDLWKSDGTRAGTIKVVGPFGLTLRERANVDGTLFFSGDDGVSGFELWKTKPRVH